jgi:hypothetical protein
MGPASLDHRIHGLTEVQAGDLANRLKSFWDGLSAEDQAHLDGVLRRLIDEGGDVSSHGRIEYALVVQLIALAGNLIFW